MYNFTKLDCTLPHSAVVADSVADVENLSLMDWESIGRPHVFAKLAKYVDNDMRVYHGLVDFAHGYRAIALECDGASLSMLAWDSGDFVFVDAFESLVLVATDDDVHIYKRVSD